MFVREIFPLVYHPKHVRYNDSHSQIVYEEGMEIEMLKLIGIALNMSLEIAVFVDVLRFLSTAKKDKIGHKNLPFIFVGMFPGISSTLDNIYEYTRSYLTVRLVWYTPCAVKYERWSRFFNIFSVDMWIFLVLSLALAVITVRCISNYTKKHNCTNPNLTAPFSLLQPILQQSHCQCL